MGVSARVFNGKRYYQVNTAPTKIKAIGMVFKLRRRGFYARYTKGKGEYIIWARAKKHGGKG
jgi:hypothetical protein